MTGKTSLMLYGRVRKNPVGSHMASLEKNMVASLMSSLSKISISHLLQDLLKGTFQYRNKLNSPLQTLLESFNCYSVCMLTILTSAKAPTAKLYAI